MSTDTTTQQPKIDPAADCVIRSDASDQAIASLQWTHPANMPPMLSYTTYMGGCGIYSIQKNPDGTVAATPLAQITAPKTTTCVLNKAAAQPPQNSFGGFSSAPQERFAPNTAALPMLCSTLTEGGDFFVGSCSGCVYHYDLKALGNGASLDESYRVVARHARPVSAVAMLPNSPMLITASWDKSIRVWDLRQPPPTAAEPLFQSGGPDGSAAQIALNAPVEDLQIALGPNAQNFNVNADLGAVRCVALCPREGALIDFAKMQAVTQLKPLPNIRGQLSCAAVVRNDENVPYGCITGSRDGRVMVKRFDEEQPGQFGQHAQQPVQSRVPKSYSFIAHKAEKQLRPQGGLQPGQYPVNAVDAHPRFPYTILSAGSDGIVKTWDIEKKRLINTFDYGYQPVTAAKFSGGDGDLLALSLGCDWSRGPQNFAPGKAGGIVVKRLKIDNVQAKA